MLNKTERAAILTKMAEVKGYMITANISKRVHHSTADFNNGMAWGLEVAAKAAGIPETVLWEMTTSMGNWIATEHLPCKEMSCRNCQHCRIAELAKMAAAEAEDELARRRSLGY